MSLTIDELDIGPANVMMLAKDAGDVFVDGLSPAWVSPEDGPTITTESTGVFVTDVSALSVPFVGVIDLDPTGLAGLAARYRHIRRGARLSAFSVQLAQTSDLSETE